MQRFDDNMNPISESHYRMLNKYKRLEKSWNKIKGWNDYNAQYNLIEKMNWLAHSIAKKSKDKTLEKYTYKIKDAFAKSEIKRRWSNIIQRDSKINMPYIIKPDWKKSYHVSGKVLQYAKKQKKRGK